MMLDKHSHRANISLGPVASSRRPGDSDEQSDWNRPRNDQLGGGRNGRRRAGRDNKFRRRTNDAIRGTTAAQEYGYKGALRSILAHCQAGSVYPHNDSTVSATGTGPWAEMSPVS